MTTGRKSAHKLCILQSHLTQSADVDPISKAWASEDAHARGETAAGPAPAR